MRYLKAFNESDNFDKIVSYLKDVLIDMTDDNLTVEIRRPNINTIFHRKGLIEISISGSRFEPIKYIDSFDHMNSYLEIQGYKFYNNGTMYDTYLEKRNLSLNIKHRSVVYLGFSYIPLKENINI